MAIHGPSHGPWPAGLTALGGLFRLQSFPGRLGLANGTGGTIGAWRPWPSDSGVARQFLGGIHGHPILGFG